MATGGRRGSSGTADSRTSTGAAHPPKQHGNAAKRLRGEASAARRGAKRRGGRKPDHRIHGIRYATDPIATISVCPLISEASSVATMRQPRPRTAS